MEKFSSHTYAAAFSSEELIKRGAEMNKTVNRDFSSLLLYRNIHGQKPIDIAYSVENRQAYRILKKVSSVDEETTRMNFFTSSSMSVLSGGVSLVALSVPLTIFMTVSGVDAFTTYTTVGLIAGFGAFMCYDFFASYEKKIKKSLLEN